jgi:hypothetical protein
MEVVADYQIFDLINGNVENIGPRMQQKLTALQTVLPEDLSGKSLLDVGCDFGFWSFLAAQRGATNVLGLDRGRDVKGQGYVDLPKMNNERAQGTVCKFDSINLGKQWKTYGKHDITLLMSLYHHVFHQCEDHLPIWFWLHKHTREMLIWENPTEADDSVVKLNVSGHLHPKYTKSKILESAIQYFDYKYVGPAEHEPTRSVFIFTPRKLQTMGYAGKVVSGAGGATDAFNYKDGRRIKEVKTAVGINPYPGSMNIQLEAPFDWSRNYFRSRILDVTDRKKGLDGLWVPRWARFYPVMVEGIKAFVFKFEGDTYPEAFVELLSEKRLRDHVGEQVVIQC